MRVKRFLGQTIHEAVAKMKQEFGSEAVILHTKRIKQGGFFGLFGRYMFEVIGAMDASSEPVRSSKADKGVQTHSAGPSDHGPRSSPKPKSPQPAPKPKTKLGDVLAKETTAKNGNKTNVKDKPLGVLWPDSIETIYQQLVDCDLPKDTARNLLASVLKGIPREQWEDINAIWSQVNTRIAKEIATIDPWEFDGSQTRAVLVGPTGVGKTTTVAKLAANFALVAGKKVGLITVDTYRVAAVEQLRTYADIIGVPIRVAYTREELHEAVAAMADRDLILIDTAGRSQRNSEQMKELQDFLADLDAEIHLVVSATTKDRDLTDIIHYFSGLTIDRLIVTKLDETTGFGVLYEASYKTKAPIAFVTTGQSVPEDIEVAEPEKIAEWILGE